MQAIGSIKVGYQDIRTGRIDIVSEQPNLILYQAADIMAPLLGGKPGYQISHMYFTYENTTGTPAAPPEPMRPEGRSYFNSINGSGGIDWLRVPLITESKLVKVPDNSTDYEQNGVWFTGTSAASSSMAGEGGGLSFQSSSPFSWVTSLALVAAPDPSNSRKDLVFSRVNLTSPIQLPVGKHLVFFWLIKFA